MKSFSSVISYFLFWFFSIVRKIIMGVETHSTHCVYIKNIAKLNNRWKYLIINILHNNKGSIFFSFCFIQYIIKLFCNTILTKCSDFLTNYSFIKQNLIVSLLLHKLSKMSNFSC